jgi:hypothetical protein
MVTLSATFTTAFLISFITLRTAHRDSSDTSHRMYSNRINNKNDGIQIAQANNILNMLICNKLH